MRIDERVEALVRATLDAAVNRDVGRFESALAGFIDEETARAGLELALAVSAFVISEVEGGRPAPERLAELAEEISHQEAWLGLTERDVAAYLTALTAGTPLADALPAEGIVVIPYAVAANLLAASSQPDQGEWWFNYLDKVEAAIEATAEPSP